MVIVAPPEPPVVKHFVAVNRLSGSINLIEVIDGEVGRTMPLRHRTVEIASMPRPTAAIGQWLYGSGLGASIWQAKYNERARDNRKMTWTEVPVSA